ncbi:gluconokinase [Phycicoccus sp. BSK3Z-2]|uniref:Gluconokinase n=1 Tax=Phycicoccus avicenniae TaxID=2828860 RepID=A0A941D410_9MICO|nr:gluconokinase [Phycicoccus avicenniae]MBR7741704.1 gluconokinase [Phycicoccus avicenniae]
MGASGCGKSVVGEAVAVRLTAPFVDADDLHSAEARASMSAGRPLDDQARAPWLRRVVARMERETRSAGAVVVACSALRRRYRDVLRGADMVDVVFVHLEGSRALLDTRMRTRDHFMPPALLDSQLSTLEPLAPDERGAVVAPEGTVDDVVAVALEHLRALAPGRATLLR